MPLSGVTTVTFSFQPLYVNFSADPTERSVRVLLSRDSLVIDCVDLRHYMSSRQRNISPKSLLIICEHPTLSMNSKVVNLRGGWTDTLGNQCSMTRPCPSEGGLGLKVGTGVPKLSTNLDPSIYQENTKNRGHLYTEKGKKGFIFIQHPYLTLRRKCSEHYKQ